MSHDAFIMPAATAAEQALNHPFGVCQSLTPACVCMPPFPHLVVNIGVPNESEASHGKAGRTGRTTLCIAQLEHGGVGMRVATACTRRGRDVSALT